MIQKCKELFRAHKELILYVFFGGLTTLVNYAVFFPMDMCHIDVAISNVVAWAVSVTVAFLTNKQFVFESRDWSARILFPELAKFVGCRVGSVVVETLFLVLTVKVLQWHSGLMKILISIAVVLLNYIGSKLLFRHKKEG